MAANINTTQYANAIKTEFERRLLTRAQPRLVHGRWAMEATLNNMGSYELRKYAALSAATTPLSEGVTPSQEAAPTLSVITITPTWYGAWMRYTDKLDFTNFDPIVSEFVGILGEQAGLTVDTLIRNDVTDNATADFAGAATARNQINTSDDDITFDDVVDQIAQLEAENARPVDGGSYVAIIHPHTWAELMKDTDFQTVFTREGGDAIRSGFVGTLFNCRFYVSANAREYVDAGASSTEDVYSALFIGAESYGVVGIASLMPEIMGMDGGGEGFANRTGMATSPVDIIMKDLGEGGDDPLNQRGTIGWKAAHEESVLNSSWIRNLEHATDFSDD